MIAFPTNPTINQTYTFENKTWKWNGTGWFKTELGTVTYDFNTTSFAVNGKKVSKMASPSVLTYDVYGKISSYTYEGSTFTLSYDIYGNLISVTDGVETNTMIYNTSSGLLQEITLT